MRLLTHMSPKVKLLRRKLLDRKIAALKQASIDLGTPSNPHVKYAAWCAECTYFIDQKYKCLLPYC